MAAAAACRRAVRLRTGSTRIQLICPNRFQSRHISELLKSNGKRLFLVDTLALVRRLEAQGVPSKQAEAITAAMTEVLNDSLENVSYSFVSKGEMQKNEMTQESNLSKFKTEVKSSQLLQLISGIISLNSVMVEEADDDTISSELQLPFQKPI